MKPVHDLADLLPGHARLLLDVCCQELFMQSCAYKFLWPTKGWRQEFPTITTGETPFGRIIRPVTVKHGYLSYNNILCVVTQNACKAFVMKI